MRRHPRSLAAPSPPRNPRTAAPCLARRYWGLFFATEYSVTPAALALLQLGIFVAMMLRFDAKQQLAAQPYFYSNMVAYVLGLVATLAVMHFFDAAQPALLYLVPACIGASLLTAAVRGEVKALLSFRRGVRARGFCAWILILFLYNFIRPWMHA